MQKINGWNDREMEGQYLTYVHPDDLELVEKTHGEVLLNPDMPVNIVYRILHKNGYYIWIESQLCNKLGDKDIGAIITVTRDITERKLVEDKLIKSEDKYRWLIEHPSDAIYLLDYACNFTDVNKSMSKLTGYHKTELLELNIENHIWSCANKSLMYNLGYYLTTTSTSKISLWCRHVLCIPMC